MKMAYRAFEYAKDRVLEFFENARPALVIEFPSNAGTAPKFHRDRFLQIVARGSTEGLPIVVICIAGPMRNGKSFLLNLMVNYLRYMTKNNNDSGWNYSTWPVKFGNFQSGYRPHTRGIWIWNHPFIVDSSKGKVALLLMDCQGLGDPENSSPKLENMIVYTALELSTVFIWNSKQCFNAEDLEKLAICAGIANIDEERALFDSIYFVIRDWESDFVCGQRNDILEDRLRATASTDMNDIKHGIRNAFVTKECYALGRPGQNVIRASDTGEPSLTVNAISSDSAEFVASAKTLFQAITHHSKETEPWKSGRDLIQHFKVVDARLDALVKDGLILTRSADLLEDAAIARARKVAQKLYEDGLMQLAESSVPLDEEGLHQAVNALVRKTEDQFETSTAYYQKSSFTKIYKGALDDLLKTKQDDINVLKIVKRISQRYKELDIKSDTKILQDLDASLKNYLRRKEALPSLLEDPNWYEKIEQSWLRKLITRFKRFFNIS